MAQLIFNNMIKDEAIRFAVYKKRDNGIHQNLNTITWHNFAVSPNGGTVAVDVPETYEAFVSYAIDPADRDDSQGLNQTCRLPFSELTARFKVGTANTQDLEKTAPEITQVFTDLMINQVRIDNHYSDGVWSHITQGGKEIFPPQVISPRAHRIEDLRATFYVAVIDRFVENGTRLVDAEFSSEEMPILVGQTVTVTGSKWKGYELKVTG